MDAWERGPRKRSLQSGLWVNKQTKEKTTNYNLFSNEKHDTKRESMEESRYQRNSFKSNHPFTVNLFLFCFIRFIFPGIKPGASHIQRQGTELHPRPFSLLTF